MIVPAWLKGMAVLLVTLAAGMAIGVSYERQRTSSRAVARPDAYHLMQRLNHSLDLDPTQQAAIAAIFARHQGAVDSTWRKCRPRQDGEPVSPVPFGNAQRGG